MFPRVCSKETNLSTPESKQPQSSFSRTAFAQSVKRTLLKRKLKNVDKQLLKGLWVWKKMKDFVKYPELLKRISILKLKQYTVYVIGNQ